MNKAHLTVQSTQFSNNKAFAKRKQVKRNIYKNRYLYMMILPVLVYYIVFHYIPIYGAQIAFRDFNPFQGFWQSTWVGFKYFRQFFDSVYFSRLLYNTFALNLYDLLIGFPSPIILALMMNEVQNNTLKRTVQTIVYLPHFISIVVLAGMIISFLSPQSGIVNLVIKSFGGEPVHFLAEPSWFRTIYVWSGIWQGAGWSSIIYLAALTGINQSLYEAAIVDGATRWNRLIHITIPCIIPTVIIMFILRMGSMFSIGYEKVMLLYNPITYETADVISTYVYRRGIEGGEYSFSTAVGLFNSAINFTMLFIFNRVSSKVSEISLW